MEKVIIIGAGGHAKVLIDCIEEEKKYEISAIVDDDPDITAILNHGVSRREIGKIESYRCIVAIGNPHKRKEVVLQIKSAFFSSIHPRASVSKYCTVGEGSQIFAGAVINAGAIIGKHCIINTGAIIEHDCLISDFVHVSPNASLAGGVKIGEASNIGMGAVVIQNIRVGSNVIIGAGAVVISNISDNCTVVGVPAKPIKFHN